MIFDSVPKGRQHPNFYVEIVMDTFLDSNTFDWENHDRDCRSKQGKHDQLASSTHGAYGW